ncbi:hypothetical protein DSO57_1038900 [Entomophthora muscae]|uniref:Uncharacterized protein n=1 Tax=Entomophthora muscae TaxID=34485 RepID=A0ACC2T9L8_9FUNG|nr:hypothetical protein DSO57_1038900 [Entomophthora muscae]
MLAGTLKLPKIRKYSPSHPIIITDRSLSSINSFQASKDEPESTVVVNGSILTGPFCLQIACLGLYKGLTGFSSKFSKGPISLNDATPIPLPSGWHRLFYSDCDASSYKLLSF